MSSPDILVVDDDPDVNEVVRVVLEDRGYRVRTAENGREALEQVMQARPSLILLDLMMPVMTGVEFLEAIKNVEALAGVPIIVVSAWAEDEVFFPNVAAVVKKPFELRQLLQRMDICLRKGGEAHPSSR